MATHQTHTGDRPSPLTGHTLTNEMRERGRQNHIANIARRKANAEAAALQVFADAALEAAGVTVAELRGMDPRLRLEAARDVLNRVLGKPIQATEVRVGPALSSFGDEIRKLSDEELHAEIDKRRALLAVAVEEAAIEVPLRASQGSGASAAPEPDA